MIDIASLASKIMAPNSIAAKMGGRDYTETDKYSQHMKQAPQYEDYRPSTLRRIGIALAQAATGMRDPRLGAQLATETLDSGFNRAMGDWKNKGVGLGEASDLEMRREQARIADENAQAESARRNEELKLQRDKTIHGMGIDDRQENRADEAFGFTKERFGKEFELDESKLDHSKRFDWASLAQRNDLAKMQDATEREAIAGRLAASENRGGSSNTTGPSPSQQDAALKLAKQQIAMEVPKLMEYYDEETKQFNLDPRDPEQQKLMQLLMSRRDQILRQYKGGSGKRNLERVQ